MLTRLNLSARAILGMVSGLAAALAVAGCGGLAPLPPGSPVAAVWRGAPGSQMHDPVATPTPAPTAAPTPLPTPVPTPWRSAGVPRLSTAASVHRTPPPPAAAPPAPATPVSVGRVYDVGDSVTLDVKPYLEQDVNGITVDGRVSRQWDTGVAIINSLRQSGHLPPTVVVDLGTNGTVTSPQFDAMMRAAAGASRVVFVSVRVPRSWEASDNSVIRAGVARYGNTALADWYSLSQGHPEWFYSDGYHLTPSGSRALASLIASVI